MSFYNDPFARDDEEENWVITANGNQCLVIDGAIAATVFRKYDSQPWAIIINRQGVGYFAENEYFEYQPAALERAEAIVNGAKAYLVKIQPRGQRVQRRAP
jgi:hypothetical protein